MKRHRLILLKLGGLFDRSGTALTVLSVLPPRTNTDCPKRG